MARCDAAVPARDERRVARRGVRLIAFETSRCFLTFLPSCFLPFFLSSLCAPCLIPHGWFDRVRGVLGSLSCFLFVHSTAHACGVPGSLQSFFLAHRSLVRAACPALLISSFSRAAQQLRRAARLPGDEQHERSQGFERLVRCVSCVAGAQRTDGPRLVAAQRMACRAACLCRVPG